MLTNFPCLPTVPVRNKCTCALCAALSTRVLCIVSCLLTHHQASSWQKGLNLSHSKHVSRLRRCCYRYLFCGLDNLSDLRPLPLPPRQGVCPHFYCVFAPSHFLFVICYLLFVIWYLLFAIAIHVECVVTSNAIGIYKTFFWPNFKCNFTPRFFSAVLKFVKYPVAGRKRYFNLYCILICWMRNYGNSFII